MKHIWICLLLSISVFEALSQSARTLQYFAEDKGFVCENGNNRYTRALYGSHENWRLETSDRPIFATFDKGKAWNVQITMLGDGVAYRLDSAAYCRAYYEGGMRSYILRDERWGDGEIRVLALAEHTGNNALWKFEVSGFPFNQSTKNAQISFVAVAQPIANLKMKRNGDLGTDSRESFEAISDCPDSLMQHVAW